MLGVPFGLARLLATVGGAGEGGRLIRVFDSLELTARARARPRAALYLPKVPEVVAAQLCWCAGLDS